MRRVIAFGNETTQLLGAHNTALKPPPTGRAPEMSPDGTKLGYASIHDGGYRVLLDGDAPPGSASEPARPSGRETGASLLGAGPIPQGDRRVTWSRSGASGRLASC